ncbi:MAG: hypothetical protein IH921_07990 [Gemmatimonadetes bacterium]|nr:hypothetical protein [Gemmatimonadota bacterium]
MDWTPSRVRALFSGHWSSLSFLGQSPKGGVRGFWVRVDTDLVIHGATDPHAKVTIQGQAVTLRKDGTFSLRVALPEGEQSVAIDVVSPDGRHRRRFNPIIARTGSGSLHVEAVPEGTFDIDNQLTLAMGYAPAEYRQTPLAKAGLEKLLSYLRTHPPSNPHHKAMMLWASVKLPGVVDGATAKRWRSMCRMPGRRWRTSVRVGLV